MCVANDELKKKETRVSAELSTCLLSWIGQTTDYVYTCQLHGIGHAYTYV